MESGRNISAGLQPEFWKSQESALLVDSRRPNEELELFKSFFQKSGSWGSHVWLASSGSSQSAKQSTKLIGLSKAAVLASAESVNQHLSATSQDRWGLCLPTFHIGGLSIGARASLTGSAVREFLTPKWNAQDFQNFLIQEDVTLASLVPTQIHDLVKLKLRAPKKLRAIVVGGGALSSGLYRQAKDLGWPLLPSFGMTEASSQVATAELSSLGANEFPALRVLRHFDYLLGEGGRLGLRGPAMMSGYWQRAEGQDQFLKCNPNDYFWTSDFVREVKSGFLVPLGRDSDFIKILGEGVHLGQLEEKLSQLLGLSEMGQSALVAFEDPRRGYELVLVTELQENILEPKIKSWNAECLPVERIGKILKISRIPRTSLGKVQRLQLLELARGN